MTLESILLLALFALFVMGALTSTPIKTYTNYGPLLGARVEKQIITGDGFTNSASQGPPWK